MAVTAPHPSPRAIQPCPSRVAGSLTQRPVFLQQVAQLNQLPPRIGCVPPGPAATFQHHSHTLPDMS
jgi:hypothetical protein